MSDAGLQSGWDQIEERLRLATAGRYSVTRRLGVGGMGAVFQAHDERLQRQVAIKVLAPRLMVNPEFEERFLREARTVARLRHPHLIYIHDMGQGEGLVYFVMSYVPGRSLSEVSNSAGGLPFDVVRAWLYQIASALAYAHHQGVVHRDLKPSNVLLDQVGDAVVTDFGIAKDDASDQGLTSTGMIIGSPPYLSPEQWNGEAATPASDQYALGVLAYEMLVGRPPFDGPPVSVMQATVTNPPPSIHAARPDCPDDLGTLVERMLAKEPQDRWVSLDAVCEELSASVVGETVIARTHLAVSELPSDPQEAPDREAATGSSGEAADPGLTVLLPGPPPTAGSEVGMPPPSSLGDQNDRTMLVGASTQVFATGPDPEAASRPAFALVTVECPDARLLGRRIPVSQFPFRVGRSESNELQIAFDNGVSREHGELVWDEGAVFLRDLGSTNGLFVNGHPVASGESVPLRFEDRIRLSSKTTLQFVSEVAPLPEATGGVLADRYDLTELLHHTVKASIYAASDRRIPRRTAIKLFNSALFASPHYGPELKSQVDMAARLDHPGICRVIDYGEGLLEVPRQGLSDRVTYLIMPLMEGRTLAERLESGNVSAETSLEWIDAIADALSYAHESGIVHAGIKPGCIVFDHHGTPYLSDFAHAVQAEQPAQGPLVGAPAFLAPEQWARAPCTSSTDQYSLGVLAYVLLTGKRPFVGQENPEVRERNFERGPMQAHIAAEREGRSLLEPVSRVLGKALSADAADRFESVTAFTGALRQAFVQKPPTVKRISAFVSYQRIESAVLATYIAEGLRRHGIHVFIDVGGRDSAGPFPDRIRNQISAAEFFVCVLSAGTLASKWVRNEIELAHQLGKTMVPVFQEAYVVGQASDADSASVRYLLEHEGVKFLDRQNLYLSRAVEDLADLMAPATS